MPDIEIAGLRIHYHRVDAPAAGGRRVLFVHGTGCNGSLWRRAMNALAEAGHSSVAIDLPGHGQSAGTGFRGVADYAHFVSELAVQLGWSRYAIAGHSLGGGVALAAAIYDATPLDGLLLIDTGARLRVNPTILHNARRIAAGDDPQPGNPRFGYAEGTPADVIAEIATLRSGEGGEVLLKDWIADDSCDFMSRLGSIAVPAIAICGDEDPLTPVKYHEYFRDHLPDCSLEVIRGAGHWPHFEQPEAFDAAVRGFLDRPPTA